MAAKTRTLPGRISGSTGPLAYAVNARVTEQQRAKLARMAQGSRGTGAAIRRAIDAYGEEPGMEATSWSEGRVTAERVRYEEELDRIEFRLEFAQATREEVDDAWGCPACGAVVRDDLLGGPPPYFHEHGGPVELVPVEAVHGEVEQAMAWPLELEHAEGLLAQLSEAVEQARAARRDG